MSPPPPETFDTVDEDDAPDELLFTIVGVEAADAFAACALLVGALAVLLDALEHAVVVTSPTATVTATHISRFLTESSPSLAPNILRIGSPEFAWVG